MRPSTPRIAATSPPRPCARAIGSIISGNPDRPGEGWHPIRKAGSGAARHAGAAPAAAPPAYTPVARLLHSVTAALVLALILIGLIMVHLLKSGPAQDFLFTLHESLGITVMAVVYFRIAYRLTHPPMPLPPEIPDFYRIAGQSVHYLLYALLVAQPALGWIGTSAYRAPVHFFWTEVPPIWPENRAVSDQVFWVHLAVGLAIAGLVCLHAGAGLFHHFMRRDVVLMRMVRG